MAFRTNRKSLVAVRAAGRIAPPRLHVEAMGHDREGTALRLPGTGGIALGVHTGDRVDQWLGDHLMPGASIEDTDGTPAVAGSLHLLACVGNTVFDAVGRRIGVVAGKRGGLAPGYWAPQLVGVELSDAAADGLNCEDRVVVDTVGCGLTLSDHPEISLSNLSPRLLDALPLVAIGERLECVVSAIVPPETAGAGLGQDVWVGDLEIAEPDAAPDMRFGDLVAFEDIDSAVTRHYRPGWTSIGIVSHGSSPVPGHGIGVTILLSAPTACLRAVPGDGSLSSTLRDWATAGEEA